MKKSFNFRHFKRYPLSKTKFGYDYNKSDGFTCKSIQTTGGCILPEWLEDMDIELSIKDDGSINISILNPGDYDNGDINEFNKFIKDVNWEGWEFMTFFDNRDGDILCSDMNFPRAKYEYRLIGCENSDIFDVVTSKKNISNLKNMEKALKK